MLDGGGKTLISSGGDYPNPSSSGVVYNNENYYFSFSYIDDEDTKLAVRDLTFDSDDWPELGDEATQFSYPHISDDSLTDYLTFSGRTLDSPFLKMNSLFIFIAISIAFIF